MRYEPQLISTGFSDMQSLRLWVWLASALVAIVISKQTLFTLHIGWALDSLSVPQWLYLLPFSLTLAWIIAQLCFVWLNTLKISPRGKAVFITGKSLTFSSLAVVEIKK